MKALKYYFYKGLKMRKTSLFTCFFILLSFAGFAQTTTIRGRVTEAGTNIGLPYVNVFFKGTLTGTVTDFEGNYSITTTTPSDSIYASYLGYKSKAKKVIKGQSQVIDIQMQQGSMNLAMVVVHPGENPALRIIRNAIRNKSRYDPEKLASVKYQSYFKQEFDVDNISERMRKRRIFRKFTKTFDSMDSLAGEDSKANLPVALMEILSDVHIQKDPFKKREDVIAAKMRFVGMKDGNVASQLTGADFNNYNFFNDNVMLARKDFLSPIANGALIFYNYELLDSGFVGSQYCYRINVKPKNKNDLAFTGTIWVQDTSFTLKQVDLEVTKDVNLNFISRIKIQQELVNAGDSAYFPSKTKILVNYLQFSKRFASLLIKIYSSNRAFVVNPPIQETYFNRKVTFKEDFLLKDSSFWKSARHEQLTKTEEKSYEVIDTIRNLPIVKASVGALYFLGTGFTSNTGPVEFGPYMLAYARNPIEGDRIRIGFRTNTKFSTDWVLRGYGAYGFQDERFKYNLQVERILSHFPWVKAGVQHRFDLDQAGTNFEFSRNSSFSGPSASLYSAASQIAEFNGYVRKSEYRSWIEGELSRGLLGRLAVSNITAVPFGNYARIVEPGITNGVAGYVTSEVLAEIRISPGEYFVQNGNERYSLGNPRKPVITIGYNQAFKNVLSSTVEYSKVYGVITQKIRMGIVGYTQYTVRAGKVFSKVPFNLLELPRGNETFFFAGGVFNLMNYAEFAADEQVSLFYQHHFQGLFFNRVPLFNRIHLREVVSVNSFFGRLSSKNSYILKYHAFNELRSYPYTELAFGVENIFKFLRVDFVYRLTYNSASYFQNYMLQNPGSELQKYGVKMSIQVHL